MRYHEVTDFSKFVHPISHNAAPVDLLVRHSAKADPDVRTYRIVTSSRVIQDFHDEAEPRLLCSRSITPSSLKWWVVDPNSLKVCALANRGRATEMTLT